MWGDVPRPTCTTDVVGKKVALKNVLRLCKGVYIGIHSYVDSYIVYNRKQKLSESSKQVFIIQNVCASLYNSRMTEMCICF